MRQIMYLGDNDIILKTDFCRPLVLSYADQSDTLLASSPYSGKPLNHLKWVIVHRAGIDFFIGKTVGDFNRKFVGMEYEFVRGEIPESAILF